VLRKKGDGNASFRYTGGGKERPLPRERSRGRDSSKKRKAIWNFSIGKKPGCSSI